jgi:hypothetical protein
METRCVFVSTELSFQILVVFAHTYCWQLLIALMMKSHETLLNMAAVLRELFAL